MGEERRSLKRGYSVVLAFALLFVILVPLWSPGLMHICLKSREMRSKERRERKRREGRRRGEEGRTGGKEEVRREKGEERRVEEGNRGDGVQQDIQRVCPLFV